MESSCERVNIQRERKTESSRKQTEKSQQQRESEQERKRREGKLGLILFFSRAKTQKNKQKTFDQSPFDTSSTLINSLLFDEGKIINWLLCKIV